MTAPGPLRRLLSLVTLLLIFPHQTYAASPPAASSQDNNTAPASDAPCIATQDIFNGTAQLTLCTQGRKVWKERRDNARTAQIYATIINSGPNMVCDLHVEVANMKDALRWWPTWLNTTKYPYFSLSPGQTVSVGVVMPQPKGFPLIQVTRMRPCDGESPPVDDEETAVTNETGAADVPAVPKVEDAAATGGNETTTVNPNLPAAHAPIVSAPLAKAAVVAEGEPKWSPPAKPKTKSGGTDVAVHASTAENSEDFEEHEKPPDDDEIPSALTGKKKCEVKTGEKGMKVRWCVDMKPYVWVEPRNKRRYVRVQGEATNLEKDTSLCNMQFSLESNKSAVSTWPEWWPNSGFDALDPGNSFVVGANVRYKKGSPKINLLWFEHCRDPGAVAEEAVVATPVLNPVSSGGGQGGTEGWQGQGGQEQQQQQQQWIPAPAPAPWKPEGQQQQQQQQWSGNQGNQQWTPAPAPSPAPWQPPPTEQYNANNNNNNNGN